VDEASYCSNICKAKCCHFQGVACPRLDDNNQCSIYAERFAEGQPDLMFVGLVQINSKQVIQFKCSRINQLLAQGVIPKEIVDQCCVANPKLLERDYGNEIKQS